MALKILNKKETSEAEIYIYEEIGAGWYGGITAKDFVDEIKKLGAVETIHVHINSPGGDVFDGEAIYNTLRSHKANVITHIDGLAASAASLIAVAGDEVQMSGNAFMMIHNPWSWGSGFASDFRQMAERLDLIADAICRSYVTKANGTTDHSSFKAFMDEEKWFTADEAQAAGLVDTITEELQAAAKFDLSRYGFKNMPKFSAQSNNILHMPEETQVRSRIARMAMWSMTHKSASANSRSEA